jgi:hypothetical protein
MYSLEMQVFSKSIPCVSLPHGIFHSVPMQNIVAKLITLHKRQKEGCELIIINRYDMVSGETIRCRHVFNVTESILVCNIIFLFESNQLPPSWWYKSLCRFLWTLICVYQTTRRHILQEHTLDTYKEGDKPWHLDTEILLNNNRHVNKSLDTIGEENSTLRLRVTVMGNLMSMNRAAGETVKQIHGKVVPVLN